LADWGALVYPFATKAKKPFNIKALAYQRASKPDGPFSPFSSRNRSRIRRCRAHVGRRPTATRKTQSMSVTIKVALEITVSDTALEDAMAEYDELSVEGLVREILDKAIACDQVIARVDEGPNTLEEYDQLTS
jgi:hypothetical protein